MELEFHDRDNRPLMLHCFSIVDGMYAFDSQRDIMYEKETTAA